MISEFMWNKISSKYPSLSAAFRYFDRNGDSQLNEQEFIYGIE